MVRARLASMVAVVAALFAVTMDSHACVVLAPDLVLPRSSSRDLAPRNAHLWMMGGPPELMNGATFALVAIPPGAAPVPALEVRQWEQSTLFELVPDAPLAAGVRYDLWATPWTSRSRLRPEKPMLLGTFRTGTESDVTPPAPPSLGNAVLRPRVGSCGASLMIEAAPDLDLADAVLFAVWLGDQTGHIDYHAPPVQIVPVSAEDHSLELNAAPRPGSRVGVRALDLAGNLGAPVERTVVASSAR